MVNQKQRQAIPFPGPNQKQEKTPIPPDVNRPAIVLESPFAGEDKERNIQFAQNVARFYTKAGFAVFASHLLYPQFLNDDDSREQQVGIHCGFAIGVRVGSFIVFALPPWVSDLTRGMSQAMDFYRDVVDKQCYVAKFNEDGTEILHGGWQ